MHGAADGTSIPPGVRVNGPPAKGRGALSNEAGRFEALRREAVDDGWECGESLPPSPTTLLRDETRTIIARNQSPDIPFDRSINPYRGCEHGCSYCYARPSHAWLGYSPGLDFETKLLYKPDAAARLRAELGDPRYTCAPIALGTNTDPYQPVERRLSITRSILEVLLDRRHPVTVVTKGALVERDIDLLAALARLRLVSVSLSLTTLDRPLARRMEPRAAAPDRRLEAIAALAAAGVPVGVMVAPVIPVLTDHELETLLNAACAAGADHAGYVLLRLPLEVKELFREWLAAHYPLKLDHVMARIRDTRDGKDNDPRFGVRMTGVGLYAQLIRRRFEVACRRLRLGPAPCLDTTQFRRIPSGTTQLPLF